MLSPAVMQIEVAADSLQDLNSFVRVSQIKELQSFGDVRAQAIGASGLSDDFKKGYELGLETARTVLKMSGLLVMKNVKSEDLL
jgi:hypothetical protein